MLRHVLGTPAHGRRRSGPVVVTAFLLTATMTLIAAGPPAAGEELPTEPPDGAVALELPDGPFDTYISINHVGVAEGDVPGENSAVFTVTISNYWPPDLPSISVLYATWGLGEVDGPTATEGIDFEETNGLLYFTGLGSKTISVPIIGDTVFEDHETFYTKLFGDVIPAWEDLYGIGTIFDDEPWPTCGGEDATHVGTPSGETIWGTAGDDVIVAFGGKDTIYAGEGDDVVCAGAGADTVYGELGADRIFGQLGADKLYGGAGPDVIRGGGGEDLLKGGQGKDILYGGLLADKLYGNRKADTLYGEKGADALSGGLGDPDVCKGGLGVDTHLWGCETMVSIP